MNIASYITPQNLRVTELDSSNEKDDNILAELCLEASRDFERMCSGRVFYPYKNTRYYDHPSQRGHEYTTIILKDDLLQVTSFTTNNGATTVPAGDFFLRTGPRGFWEHPPYDRIELEYGSTGYSTGLNWSSTPQRANTIAGFWGYVPDWGESVSAASCWTSTGATVESATSTTLTLSALAGVDAYGLYPRLSKYDLVMWYNSTYADMEMGFVIDIDEATDTITVTRGVNGTSTDTPSGSPTLYKFKPEGSIVRAVRKLAAFYYRGRQTSRADIDRPIITATGAIIMPSALPKDVVEVVQNYQGILE